MQLNDGLVEGNHPVFVQGLAQFIDGKLVVRSTCWADPGVTIPCGLEKLVEGLPVKRLAADACGAHSITFGNVQCGAAECRVLRRNDAEPAGIALMMQRRDQFDAIHFRHGNIAYDEVVGAFAGQEQLQRVAGHCWRYRRRTRHW
jgi:hypothetical protein